jgi:hypothetical protein
MSRPAVDAVAASEDVADWYWTRAELDQIATRLKVGRSGSKAELTARLIAVLSGAEPPAPVRRSSTTLREPFQLTDVVPEGQRMTRALRQFLQAQAGADFRFDARMREFFAAPQGRTLADAVALWRSPRGSGREIPAQFEYNRFTRAYRIAHPGAAAQQVRAAWAEYKESPVSSRGRV